MTRVEGEKVILRLPGAADGEEFISAAVRSRDLHSGLVYPATTKEAFENYVARNDQETSLCFLLEESETGRIAGTINLSQIYRGPLCSAFLGYYLFDGYTGRGLMFEALNLIVNYSFTTLGLHRLEANIQPHNAASIKLVRRCGFRKEGYSRKYLKIGGEWRDHERWAIIAEDLED